MLTGMKIDFLNKRADNRRDKLVEIQCWEEKNTQKDSNIKDT